MSPILPADHPPIPTTSTSPFPSQPPAACPASATLTLSQSAKPTQSRNGVSSLSATRPPSPSLVHGNGNGTSKHRYTGEVFTLGTRNSKLAMVQTEIVRRELEERWPGCEIRIFGMTTLGDNVQTQPLYTFGGKALWTKELEVHLLDGSVDAIVHSLKDVPTEFPPGCELGAVLEREDPSDALVVKEGLPYTRLEEMPEGSIIGTSSVRRVAQLRRRFPGLKFADVRGNLGTRLRKLDDPTSSYTALILASAGLIRINLGHRITASVTSPNLYHAVGQGAIGIEIRQGDPRSQEIIGSLECWKTSWRTRAERMMLQVLEGGCSVPVGCETTITEVWVKGGEGDSVSCGEDHVKTAAEATGPPPSEPLLPLSPPTSIGVSLPSPKAVRPSTSPSLSRSPNAHSAAISPPTSKEGANAFASAAGFTPSIDETQGIPSGHPAVNPTAICPVTGRRLPSPPPAALTHSHHCHHRPGSPPQDCKHHGASHHATLELTGTITSLSGRKSVVSMLRRRVHSVQECERLGAEVARELIEGGGKEILEELGRHVKEVGNGTQHDGKPIPEYVIPGGANTAPAPTPAPHPIPTSRTSTAIPIECPAHNNANDSSLVSPSSASAGFSKSPGLSKSPHRTVFREGEVCLRPAGW
ncbi:hypothetical protein JCM11641_008145 [Rhodosporidiobolus odoratus]